ncbi:clamp loader of DNA polymerase [Chryseobacterium phage MA9V-1]|nr:clamp loader of DNA polymerase [Chryseobacterium phage MA9V-1]
MTLAKSAIWTERYRPNDVESMVLPERVKKLFRKPTITQHYLFTGQQGTGKSTLAKILQARGNSLWLNASMDNNVDTVRGSIDNYCSLQSLDDDGMKTVFLDESDLLTKPAQGILRGTIETYVDHARFIFTCNYPERLIDPIKSRLEVINFEFTAPDEIKEITTQALTLLYNIATENGMTLTRDAYMEIFRRCYPDIRSMVKTLQGLHDSGIMNVGIADLNKAVALKNEEFFKFICSKPQIPVLYTMVSTFKGRENAIIKDISMNFLPYISNDPKYLPKLGDLAIRIHKYGYESSGSLDSFVTLMALCTEIVALM